MKKIISLFSGAGGMDLGFEGSFYVPKVLINKKINSEWIESEDSERIFLKSTGFKTCFSNDILKSAEIAWNNYFTNHHDIDEKIFLCKSIEDVIEDFRQNNFDFPKDIDLVTGGFPCQDFSLAGKRMGFESSKSHLNNINSVNQKRNRGQLYLSMKDVIEITQPKMFIAENVKGMTNLGDVVRTIQEDFQNINSSEYIVFNPTVLNAADYGVPQNRERIFFIGLNKKFLKKEFIDDIHHFDPYPPKTHTKNSDLFEKDKVYHIPSYEVLKDLNEPENEKNDISQSSLSRAKFYGKNFQGNKEINLKSPSMTIRAEHHGNIEFRRLNLENGGAYVKEIKGGLKQRRLTVRECARLQTFPDEYEFVFNNKSKNLSTSAAYKLIGNSVPPLFAYHFAKYYQRIWKNIFI